MKFKNISFNESAHKTHIVDTTSDVFQTFTGYKKTALRCTEFSKPFDTNDQNLLVN